MAWSSFAVVRGRRLATQVRNRDVTAGHFYVVKPLLLMHKSVVFYLDVAVISVVVKICLHVFDTMAPLDAIVRVTCACWALASLGWCFRSLPRLRHVHCVHMVLNTVLLVTIQVLRGKWLQLCAK